MLKHLSLSRVGPAPTMKLEFDPRLNVLTGDNGLGKSFVLDIAWWALTGEWAGSPAVGERSKPQEAGALLAGTNGDPSIEWGLSNVEGARRLRAVPPRGVGPTDWAAPEKAHGAPCLVLYARIDGGFPLWDPYRGVMPEDRPPEVLNFSAQEIWDGKPLDAPRKLLTAIARVQRDVAVRVLMTTHSPLVLASLEPLFEEKQDQLFNFRVADGSVRVERVDRVRHGDATAWLQGAVFGLGEARSKEAESALDRANAFLRQRSGSPAEARRPGRLERAPARRRPVLGDVGVRPPAQRDRGEGMIPVPRPKARPKGFLARCTTRGAKWLKKHPLDALGLGKEPQIAAYVRTTP